MLSLIPVQINVRFTMSKDESLAGKYVEADLGQLAT